MKFISWDANYFKAGKRNSDCVIRALCVATNFGYKKLLELFKKADKFIMGSGYGQGVGISREEVDDFAKRTGIIEKIWSGDSDYLKYLDDFGTTELDAMENFIDNDFDEILSDRHIKSKRFVFMVREPNEQKFNGTHSYHFTPIIWYNNDWTCIDTDIEFDTVENIKYAIPLAIYAVKKIAKPDSEYYYTNEKKAIKAQQEKEFEDNVIKKRKSNKK